MNSYMTSILMFKPERHPEANQTNKLGIPIIPPTLCRTINLKNYYKMIPKVKKLFIFLFICEKN